MKKDFDIHSYQLRVESSMRSVQNADISERNKQLILDFRDNCSLEGLSLARILRYLEILKSWARLLKVDFDVATKDDIIRGVRIIQENQKYSAWTKATFKIMLKRFYKWLKKTGEDYPEEVKWIKGRLKMTEVTLPANGDLITEEEVKKLIDASDHIRDKAFISTLYESGSRIGEIASMQIGNVKFDQYGAILNVTGKTGPRPIRVISSTPYLMSWLQNHPFRNDHNAPLWVNVGTTNHNSFMQYAAFRMILVRLFAKIGMKKRFNPHMFRHSRATFLADHLTEFQMNQYFGWIQGSRMPSTYVHMSGKKIDSSILALNGVRTEQSTKESELKPRICQRCDTINVADAKYCSKCAGILDVRTAYELEEKNKKEKDLRQNYDQMMNMLMKDADFVNMFMSKIKELGLADKV